MIVNAFTKEYAFLNNFFPCNISYNNFDYMSAEAAYQAEKIEVKNRSDLRMKEKFQHYLAHEAYIEGKKVQLREDWDSVKDNIMYEILFKKFTQNTHLKNLLKNTRAKELKNINMYNDTYWGLCVDEDGNYYGKNMLGNLLMKVRNAIMEDTC